jgi:hypothetical protein
MDREYGHSSNEEEAGLVPAEDVHCSPINVKRSRFVCGELQKQSTDKYTTLQAVRVTDEFF